MSLRLTNTFKSEKTSRKRSASPVKPPRDVLKRQKSNQAQDGPVCGLDGQQEPAPSPFKTPTKPVRHADLLADSTTTSSPSTPSSSSSSSSSSSRSIYARTRAALRLSYADEAAPVLGRVEQRQTLCDFLAPRFPELCDANPPEEPQQSPSASATAHSQTTMYISGKPGSGKTVLVTQLTRPLAQEKGALLNCTAVPNLWSTLCRLLQPDLRLAGRQARSKAFDLVRERKQPFLLVLDEIDQLKPASDVDALYHLAAAPGSCLTLIGIANTLTLSTTLPPSTLSLDFPPYDAADMAAIAKQRIQSLGPTSDLLTHSAIELAARKVAAGPADLRAFLALLRRAVEQVEAATPAEQQQQQDKPVQVTPKHVLAAIKIAGLSASAQPQSLVASALANAGLMPRLALVGLCVAVDRLAVAATSAASSSGPLQPNSKARPAAALTVNYDDAWTAYNDSLRAAQHAEFVQSRNDWESLLDALVVCGVLNSDLLTKSPTAASKRTPSPRTSKSQARTKKSGVHLSLVHGLSATVEALLSPAGGEAAAIAKGVWEEEQRRRVRRRRTWDTNPEAPMAGFHGDGLEDKQEGELVGRKRQVDDHEDDLAWQ